MTADLSDKLASRRPQRVAVAAMLILGAVLAVAGLARQEHRLTATNGVHAGAWALENVRYTAGPVCIDGQSIPRGSGDVRLQVGTYRATSPPHIKATIAGSDGRVVARGSVAGYDDREKVVIRFPELKDDVAGGRVCFTFGKGKLAFAGVPYDSRSAYTVTVGGDPRPAEVQLKYFTAGKPSLISQVPAIFERAALFRPGWVGAWTFWMVFAAALAAIALLSIVLLRRAGAGAPDARRWALAIFAFAAFNALLWSVVSPSFNPPDEVAQYSYTEALSVRGERPLRTTTGGYGSYTERTDLAQKMVAVDIVQNQNSRPPWDQAAEQDWRKRDADLPARGKRDGGGWTSSAGYSPLYFGVGVIPYKLSSDNTFTRLWLMRLWSVLLCGLSAMFCFLFARELMPNSSWFAPVAGLAVAFEPMIAHIGGAFQNDNLLIALASATFWLVARGMRRGAGIGLAALIGTLLALGYVAKPTMVGLAPAIAVGLFVAVRRSPGTSLGHARSLASAGGCALLVVLIAQILWGQGGETTGALTPEGSEPFTIGGFLSYTWQWYLPGLSGMYEYANGVPPVFSVYGRGFLADFNHLDTHFSSGWYVFIAAFVAALAAGVISWGWRNRATHSQWLAEAVVCVLAIGGLALLVNLRSYLALLQTAGVFAQGRYLLSAIAVFGVFVAAGAKGFGRRYGLGVGSAMVIGLALVNLFGMAITLQRFYL